MCRCTCVAVMILTGWLFRALLVTSSSSQFQSAYSISNFCQCRNAAECPALVSGVGAATITCQLHHQEKEHDTVCLHFFSTQPTSLQGHKLPKAPHENTSQRNCMHNTRCQHSQKWPFKLHWEVPYTSP